MLRDLSIQRSYHKGHGKDDIAKDFYLPAVASAVTYDRAVGYFSSSIMLLAWPSLRQFVENGGRMRLLCSPVLSGEDEEAMRKAYSDADDAELAAALTTQFKELLASPSMGRPTAVLAALIANGVLDVRIAWVAPNASGRSTRIFHDKVGILRDAAGDRIAFKGSMNETWPALSIDGNIESIDVFCEWRDDGESERVKIEGAYFDEVWRGDWPDVVVKPLPESTRGEIISAADKARWMEVVDDICFDLDQASLWSPEAAMSGGRLPREHQVDALEAWTAAGRRGILEHATGSGKTFTALCALNASFLKGEVAIVVVPSDLLFEQWQEELEDAFGAQGVEILLCGAGNDSWRSGSLLRSWTRPRDSGSPPRVVLTTLQTASSSLFVGLCAAGPHLFLVGDEVHRLGATEAMNVMRINAGARLGLSATPRRAGDPVGTAAVLDYFGGIIPPSFTLNDAIKAGALTPYAYHPRAVHLTAEEIEAWQDITRQIRRAYASGHSDKNGWEPGAEARFKMLLIRRARLAKQAKAKVPAAVDILLENYRAGDRWIVYCDDQDQLGEVSRELRSAGLSDVYQYHAAMAGDRGATLAYFEAAGGIVVSIRCLDEGVDIPAVTHALIIASSKNPREFIQRRGRVLRRYPGKMLGRIYDLLVLPAAGPDDDDGVFDSILHAELARAIEFGANAVNPGAVVELKRIAASMNLDWEDFVGAGEEDDGADENSTEAKNVH